MARRLCTFAALGLSILSFSGVAQTSGNVAYGGNSARARAEQNERNQRVLSKEDIPPDNSMFVDADVLMNIKADEYIATFGLSREGTSVEDASAKMDATLKQFTAALKLLHLHDTDIFVDFIAEPKIYG